MKIAIYIIKKNAKQAYKKECFDIRVNAGLMVVKDILNRKGYDVDYCSSANVHKYDVILFNITSDCDFWAFIAERVKWQKGNYKVVLGGAGVLNVRPFLTVADYFVLGRAENVIDELIDSLSKHGEYESKYVVNSKTFNPDKKYYINQVDCLYPHNIELSNGKTYHEDIIGCNHKCFFCGYTWQRKFSEEVGIFRYSSGIWLDDKHMERAILDMHKTGFDINFNCLRTTAIDGLSERLRFMVNKKITRSILQEFLYKIATCEKPHQFKFYNIVGYPTETYEDWLEFAEDIKIVDEQAPKREKQACILLHNTPFRAMPATPMATQPMSYKNYRNIYGDLVGRKYNGHLFYLGGTLYAKENAYTESLSTVIQSAIVWRGTEKDTDNIIKIALSKKFATASAPVKQATLEKYFDVKKLFGKYTLDTLPTRYLETYADYKKAIQIFEKNNNS